MNKGIVGKFKDEMGDDEITDFVALGPKSYSYKTASKDSDFRIKGISTTMYYDQFLETLVTEKSIFVDEIKITSSKHEIKVKQITKKALKAYDDKRYLLQNKTFTYAYGHHKFRKNTDTNLFETQI